MVKHIFKKLECHTIHTCLPNCGVAMFITEFFFSGERCALTRNTTHYVMWWLQYCDVFKTLLGGYTSEKINEDIKVYTQSMLLVLSWMGKCSRVLQLMYRYIL